MLRREVSGGGLYWALFVVLAAMLLIASIAGIAMGAGDRLAAYVTGIAVSSLALGSYFWPRRDAATAPEPADEQSEPRYPLIEGFWGAVLALSAVGFVLFDGPQRASPVVIGLVALVALVYFEIRRRQAK